MANDNGGTPPTQRRAVLTIRCTETFLEELDAAVKSVNRGRRFGSDPFAQNVDRSKFVRSLVEDFINKQDKANV